MDAASLALECTGILITVITLLRDASERQKELGTTLANYAFEAENTKNIVELVQNEPSLRTSGATAVIVRVKELSKILEGQLQTMGKPRGSFQQFAHQVTKGSGEERAISDIFTKLVRAKQDLGLQVHLANVGLTKTLGESMAVNTTAVDKVQELMKDVLGQSLMIADFIKQKLGDKQPDPEGNILITQGEYQELQTEQFRIAHPDAASTPQVTKRFIEHNLTCDQSLQINGPIGVDIWKEIAQITIQGNVATGSSIQTNYPITMDVFDKLMAARGVQKH